MPRLHLGSRLGRRGHIGGAVAGPERYGSDLFLHLRADRGVTMSGPDVMTWTDQGPNGLVFASQAGGRPTMATAINGKATVSEGDATMLLSSGGPVSIAAPWTMIMVVRSDYPTGANVYSIADGIGCALGLAHLSANGFGMIDIPGHTGGTLSVLDTVVSGTGVAARLSTDGTQSCNGVTGATTGTPHTYALDNGVGQLMYPQAPGYDTQWGEIIVVKRVINPADLKPYLLQRYQLPFA